MVCTIAKCFTKMQMLKTFYGAPSTLKDDSISYITYIRSKLTNEEIAKAKESLFFGTEDLQLEASFFVKYNDLFASKVENFKDASIRNENNELQNLFKFFSETVSTDPNKRKPISSLEKKSTDYAITGSSISFTYRVGELEKLQNYFKNASEQFDIYDFFTSEIPVPKYSKLQGIYSPLINDEEGTYTLYKLKKASNEQYVLDKQVDSHDCFEFARFIHCMTKENESYPSLYMVGGCNDDCEAVNEVYRVDEYEKKAPMNVARYLFGATAVTGFIFVAGGEFNEDDDKDFQAYDNTVEMYDASKNIWIKANGNMKEGRKECSLVLMGPNLYAIGGIRFDEEEGKKDIDNLDLDHIGSSKIYSTQIDVFAFTTSSITYTSSFNINTPIFNSISDCSCIPSLNEGKIIILKDFLHDTENDTDDDEDVSQYELTLKEGKAEITKFIGKPNEENDLDWIYTGYNCCNCIKFTNNEYLYIPQFIETPIDDATTQSHGIMKFTLGKELIESADLIDLKIN